MVDSATVERGVGDLDTKSQATAAPVDSPRGALVIANRVGEKIAAAAALDVDGVVEYQGAVGSLLGGGTPGRALVGADYPHAHVDMSEAAPMVRVTVALQWPVPVTQVCIAVRNHVADELARLTGIRPSRVDVTVAHIVSRESSSRVSAGFVDLPDPPAETERSGDHDEQYAD